MHILLRIPLASHRHKEGHFLKVQRKEPQPELLNQNQHLGTIRLTDKADPQDEISRTDPQRILTTTCNPITAILVAKLLVKINPFPGGGNKTKIHIIIALILLIKNFNKRFLHKLPHPKQPIGAQLPFRIDR